MATGRWLLLLLPLLMEMVMAYDETDPPGWPKMTAKPAGKHPNTIL